jgi:hypothetical protein
MSDTKYRCPKCNRPIKSTSGWTLHVKQCCPELRYRKTIVNMNVTLEIPMALDGTDNDYNMKGDLDLFQSICYMREISGIGFCNLVGATVAQKNIDVRQPTFDELRTLKQAEEIKDRNNIKSEFTKVLHEIIGETKGVYNESVTLSTIGKGEINNITVRLYKGEIRKWEISTKCSFEFVYTPNSGNLAVLKRRPGVNTIQSDGTSTITVQLANPNSFDKVRKFTGLRPVQREVMQP